MVSRVLEHFITVVDRNQRVWLSFKVVLVNREPAGTLFWGSGEWVEGRRRVICKLWKDVEAVCVPFLTGNC